MTAAFVRSTGHRDRGKAVAMIVGQLVSEVVLQTDLMDQALEAGWVRGGMCEGIMRMIVVK